MDLPRDSSDIQIALACQVCNGNGGIGPRTRVADAAGTAGFQACSTCNGTGWQLKKPADLTAPQLARLVQRLPLKS